MKWFKHDTDTSSDPKIKLLRKKFGIAGVGTYFEINRLIAQNVDDNVDDWGYLPKEYTDHYELLAEEIGVEDVQLLYSICTYSTEIGLLYQHDGRLLNPKVLLRADRYTEQKAKENSLKLDEYVQKLYRLCTETTPRREEKRIEKNRIDIKATSNVAEIKEDSSTNYLLGLFKDVNPNYEKLFSNKTQRKAIEGMAKRLGADKVERTILALKELIVRPYAPVITTPLQLEQKMGDLIAFANKEKFNIEERRVKDERYKTINASNL